MEATLARRLGIFGGGALTIEDVRQKFYRACPAPDPNLLACFEASVAASRAHLATFCDAIGPDFGELCMSGFQWNEEQKTRCPCPANLVTCWVNDETFEEEYSCGLCGKHFTEPATLQQFKNLNKLAMEEDEAAVDGKVFFPDDLSKSMPKLQPDDAFKKHADRLQGFGFPVELLVAFTDAHGCWDWTTERVNRDIVRPACASLRCRYAELPSMAVHVGPADAMVSHCWAANWGTLVTAALCGAGCGRKVWVDIFAVRQFPGNVADLDFRGVVRSISIVILSIGLCTLVSVC
eukprot:SAG11_NODE_572_length_8445_cov_7.136353_3_plen_292_part_00